MEDTVQASLQFREADLEFGPRLFEGCDLEEQIARLEEILHYVDQGGSVQGFLIRVIHRDWTRYLESVAVNGHDPRNKKEIQALLEKARLEKRWKALAARWSRQVTAIGGPDSSGFCSRPESAYRQYGDIVRAGLNWQAEKWEPLAEEMIALGLRWNEGLNGTPPVTHACGETIRIRDAIQLRLLPEIEARIRFVRQGELQAELRVCADSLDAGVANSEAAPVVKKMAEALRRMDVSGYSQAFCRLRILRSEAPRYARRLELLRQLGSAAPEWMNAVQGRQGAHALTSPPGVPTAAWHWRQWHDDLQRRAERSMPALQRQIAAKTKELELETTAYIESAAWYGQHQRMGSRPEAMQALHYWVDALLGSRGTGQRATRLRLDARRLMAACREAVPVWIMPLARVAENFEPSKTRFDLVIVDEASQADLMGLIPMYFAGKVVVVGDDEQVSPDAVGQETAEIDGLISSYLEGMTGSRLFDRTYSLYSLAKANFGAPIRLREHFRCAPDIIQFSNALSYDFEIRPLRDVSQCNIRPHVISYKVDGVRGDSKCNKTEAEVVTSLIAAMCTLDQYRTSSIGMISLVGDEQARLIDVLLRKRIPLQDYVRRRIVCGNAHQFQGDERDVMVLSMVDSPADGPQRGARDMYKKRYNVAASRARDQMWVVHSLDPQTDLKPEDLRRRLLEHVLHPETLRDRIDGAQSRVESEFERQVANRLVAAGYKVVPQWKVGAYRIDLVVEGATRRLAVECDGDRYHPLEQLDAEIRRQEILERLGWTFVRLRGSQFFREPDSAMESVFIKMAELGIEPLPTDSAAEPSSSELSDEVIRIAAELRRKWVGADEDDAQSRFAYKTPAGAASERPERSSSTLRPSIRVRPTDEHERDRHATPGLRNARDVTDAEIKAAVRACLRSCSCDIDELSQGVNQALGFQPLAEPMRGRIKEVINAELRAGRLCKGSDSRL